MRSRRFTLTVLTTSLAVAAATLVVAPADAELVADRAERRVPSTEVPTLAARATLSADHVESGPPSGADVNPANGREGPFPGQVIPGFSAMIDNGNGTFWAMPDNGFGAKDNSSDFLLRLYKVKPNWETADTDTGRGKGTIKVQKHISLRDPDHRLDFPIVNEKTKKRLLTGADFDIESVVRGDDGTFWIGEEFGPHLIHIGAGGKVLSAPVPHPEAISPQSPELGDGDEPTLGSSKGFEAMAASADGRYLYPILEGALLGDDDQRRRVISEFDTVRERYTQRSWNYTVDTDANLVGDAFMTGKGELIILERDDFEGAAAVTKKLYTVDLDRTRKDGTLDKEPLADLLKIANPWEIGVDPDGDAYGVGDPFAFPMQSVETVVQLSDGRLLIANDNNYPGNDSRRTGTPDDTEMIIVDLRREKAEPNSIPVVGHRGASGYRPEHTLASYELAIRQCVDYIEPDVVSTSDGHLVTRHENEIGGTTDVATHDEFADRKTTKTIDGKEISGWFTEDFTLAELRTLRTTERIPDTRPDNTDFDGLYPIPTLDEVLDLARNSRTCAGGEVGVYPETKHPTYFDSVDLSLEKPMVQALKRAGLNRTSSPVILQSFETANLKELNRRTDVPIAQIVGCSGAPYDLVEKGDERTYADLVTKEGLQEISRYADGVSLCKDVMIPRTEDGELGEPSPVIDRAHRYGMDVHGWTFRAENQFLPTEFRSSDDENEHGDMAGEIEAFLAAGMDGILSDHPDLAIDALPTEN